MKYSVEFVSDIVKKIIPIKSIEFIGCGNHSEAFGINNEIVIKLPKHRKASECLKTEMHVLRGLEQKINLEIPNVLFEGVFSVGNDEFVYFASKRLKGKTLSKADFVKLDERTTELNAERIARFLFQLHSERQILPTKRKDLCLLHGDFSLNHILFDEDNMVCGVLDFGDSRVGKPQSDFIYLLDDEDDEEFDATFGEMVRNIYESYMVRNANL